MDNYEAIDIIEGILKGMPSGKIVDAIRIALQALKDSIGYCEECKINYEDDCK